MRRKEVLASGEIYHIFNKSIADFKIFNTDADFCRMKNSLRYYQLDKRPLKFSQYLQLEKVEEEGFDNCFNPIFSGGEKAVQIIAYCLMHTHFHLILKQLKENGISIFMGSVLNSYSHYFNTKHKRKGPLWEGKFKNVLVRSDEQLLHLTRYIHLNPVTSYLVDKSEDWPASSCREYLLKIKNSESCCSYDEILNIEPGDYKKFLEDRVSYQRELGKIKEVLFD